MPGRKPERGPCLSRVAPVREGGIIQQTQAHARVQGPRTRLKYWKRRRILLFQMGAMSQLRFLTSCSSPHRPVLTRGRSAFPPAWAQAGTPRGGVIPESGSRITVPSSCLPSDPSPFPFPLPPSSTLGSYPQSDDLHDTACGAQVALKPDFSCPQRGPAELPGQPRRASPAPPNQRCPRDSAGGEEQPVGPGLREGEEVEVTARDRRERRASGRTDCGKGGAW